MMKTTRIIPVTIILLFVALRCFAFVKTDLVSKGQAEKDFGAKIRAEVIGTNQVSVWLEFASKGKLQNFDIVRLEITSGEGELVSADLAPSKYQASDKVVFQFLTTPAHVSDSRFIIFMKNDDWPYSAQCYQFNVSDFVKHEPSH